MSPRQSAVWFGQLAALARAGIPLPAALRQAGGAPAAAREKLAAALETGTEPREAWTAVGFLSKSDALVAAAGQRSGRFPEACLELSHRHETAAGLRAKMLMACLYPLFLLSFALFVTPFIVTPDFSGKSGGGGSVADIVTTGCVRGVTGVALFWIAVFVLREIANRKPQLRAALLRLLPIWAGAAKHAAYSVFAGTLASLLRAGVGIGEAWLSAGEACGDPGVAKLSRKVAEAVENRSAPGTVLAASGVFPGSFRDLYLAGEVSGSLEDRLDELSRRHADEAGSRATVAAFAYSKALMLVVMVLVAVKIVSFWTGYYDGIEQMLK